MTFRENGVSGNDNVGGGDGIDPCIFDRRLALIRCRVVRECV
jgi:hypothetical protein